MDFLTLYFIEKGRALNDAEVDYVVAIIMGWIERQIYALLQQPYHR